MNLRLFARLSSRGAFDIPTRYKEVRLGPKGRIVVALIYSARMPFISFAPGKRESMPKTGHVNGKGGEYGYS